MSQATWDDYFIMLAFAVASKSKDTSTKVGVVIVGPNHGMRSTGYNDFPRRVKDDIPERRVRPEKYLWTEHTERNAIYNAANAGIAINGCTMYINWEPYPCPDCARAVIQAGIIEVVGPDRPFVSVASANRQNWEEGFKRTKEMFAEAGIVSRIVPFTQDRILFMNHFSPSS
ncbi:MAG: deaminase [Patescibacteria group bacterium]|nr:deaminase [Patescibacteria group bacterium]